MCYQIYVSTTSEEDLAALPTDLFRFELPTADDRPDILQLLAYPHKWYLACRYGGCSCHYRHLGEGSDFSFDQPQDWMPEDSDDVESTQGIYDLVERLLAAKQGVDLVDVWEDPAAIRVTTLSVKLSDVSRDAFRFFANHKFVFE
jgi:hypothetical protein